ncbi:von Willebrand factor type A domain [Dermatophilus congolensis]|uniref:von Willebrand factor type A domain n=1 Tax=Dermatophilus congolensis TaxID=1863 RepID=A0A239V6G9_9MICO|nr:von Willebrand factor type A domain [Dermatophilus congolensis]
MENDGTAPEGTAKQTRASRRRASGDAPSRSKRRRTRHNEASAARAATEPVVKTPTNSAKARLWLPLTAFVVALCLLAGLSTFITLRSESNTAAFASSKPGCARPPAVKVSVPPTLEPIVQAAIDEVTPKTCAKFELTAETDDVVLASIKDPGKRPALWLSAADTQVERARSQNPSINMNASDVLYTSPIIVATPKERAAQTKNEITWKALFEHPKELALPNPESNAAGLLGLLSAAASIGIQPLEHPTTGPRTIALFQASQPGNVHSAELPTKAPEWGQGLFVTSEQAFAAYAKEHADSPLVALAPEGGSVFLSYRAVTMPTTDPNTAHATDALIQALSSEAGQKRATDAGFRNEEGKEAPEVPAPDGPTRLKTDRMDQPSTEHIRSILTQWMSVAHGMRLITLVDTSQSMGTVDGTAAAGGAPGAGPGNRITHAAGSAANGLAGLPSNNDVGLWEFSQNPAKPGNWREVVPFGPLGDEKSDQRGKLKAAAQSVPGAVGGNTPLFDTLLDAVLKLQEGYDPKRMNVVLVLTDGKNDSPDSMNLSGLSKTLQRMTNNGRRISVAAVGIGKDVDQGSLKKIAEVTNGAFYYAEKPEDVDPMVAKALLDFSPTAKAGNPLP